MTIKPGAFRFNTDSMKLEIFRGADTGAYNNPIEDVVAYSGTSLFWDDSPIGAYTLSNNNRTATTNDGNSGSYTNGDVYSTAIAAGNTYAWTLRVTNGDTTGGWYFTDSQTASGTHADQRNESSGNASGLRGGETGASTYGAYATANGTSSAQNQIALNSDVSPNGNKNIEFVVYRPSSGTGKVWIRAEGAGSWIGGGDPSNTSSTATIVLPDATTYFGFVQYDRSTAATFILDIESSGGYYGPRLAGQWEEIQATSPEVQTGGTRGVYAIGANNTTYDATTQYITVNTTGNAQDFGDTSEARGYGASFSSRTRGVFLAGQAGGANKNVIDFITIASTGTAATFGNISDHLVRYPTGLSNATRGLLIGGYDGSAGRTELRYVTIASTGNTIDFGDSAGGSHYASAACASPTRGIFQRGSTTDIEFITISTQGNAASFGDTLLTNQSGQFGLSNSVRGVFAGGYTPGGTNVNTISYISIPTLGNALDFGDLTRTNAAYGASLASATRGVFAGGGKYPAGSATIDYVQIMSTGNAIDFGDAIDSKSPLGAMGVSNGHGGL